MTLLVWDGMSWPLAAEWTQAGTVTPQTATGFASVSSTTRATRVKSGGTSRDTGIRRSLPSAQATGVALGFRYGGEQSSFNQSTIYGQFCSVRSASAPIVTVIPATGPTLEIRQGSATGSLLATTPDLDAISPTVLIDDGVWRFYELVLDLAGGSVQLWVDDVMLAEATGVDWAGATAEAVQIGTPAASASAYVGVDDVYVTNLDGTDLSGRLGAVRIGHLPPTSKTGWTGTLAGISGWATDTTDIATSSTDQEQMTGSLADLLALTATDDVPEVRLHAIAASPSGAGGLTLEQVNGGQSTTSGAITPVPTTTSVRGYRSATAPGGGEWDEAQVNALTYRVTSEGTSIRVHDLEAQVLVVEGAAPQASAYGWGAARVA